MRCPVDGADLRMTERHGVEIDYCPACRGVWLDRGKLDKIIDRAEGPRGRGDDDDRGDRREHHGHPQHHRKRESFWGRVFDFD